MISVEDLLSKTLKEKGYSLTKPRLLVFEEINKSAPLTVRQLIDQINNKVDRASVYRTLTLFEETNVIQRIYAGWKYKVELSDRFNEHHHHLTCQKCGKVIPIHNQQLEKFIEEVAERANFKITSHQLEIQGLCKNCAKTA